MPSLRYHDQNNNLYHLEGRAFRYRPIQPKESSSGLYSGGEPAEHQISAELSQEIFALAEQILKTSSIHTQQRRMLTSVLSLKSDQNWRPATLVRSPLRTDLEALLDQARAIN